MGDWDTEPNEIDFKDDATGLQCAMRRNSSGGYWCGYVALPEGHALHGKHYHDPITVPAGYMDREAKVDEDYGAIALFCGALAAKPEENVWPLELAVRCHGGLTYSANHAPSEDPDGRWWFGFDCAHAGDLCPNYSYSHGSDDVYRNAEYVRASLAKLCRDIAAISEPLAAAA